MSVGDPTAPVAQTAAVVPSARTDVVPANPDYPAKLDVPYVSTRPRGSLFFRRLKTLNISFALMFATYSAMFQIFINHFHILFTGRYRQRSFERLVNFLKMRFEYLAYRRMLVADPPFIGQTSYLAEIELPTELPTVSSRFRWLYVGWLVIPQTFVAFFTYFFAGFAAWFGKWAAVFNGGHFPEGPWRFNVIALRRMLRLQVYLLLMTEQKPPSGKF